MDGDFSSSSCYTEGEEMNEKEKMDIVNVQAIMLENERLHEINSHLQSALDSTKLQLKQALDASASVTAMTDQIRTLRQQLSMATVEKDKVTNELSIFKSSMDQREYSNENSGMSLNNTNDNINSNNSNNNANNSELIKKIKKLKEETKNLLKENEYQKQVIESLQSNQTKLQKRKSKLTENLKNIVNQLKQSEDKNSSLTSANQKLETGQKALTQENESLKVQLNAAHSFNSEAETAYKSLNEDLSKQNKAFKLINDKIEAQKNEIGQLNHERQRMIDLICNLHSAVLSSESITNDLLNQKEGLERKVKAAKFSSEEERLNLSESDIPFEGDLRMKCIKILMIEQYTPSHRIQLILNEANQHIKHLVDQLDSSVKEADNVKSQFNVEKNGAEKYREMMRALLKELKNITLMNEKVNSIAFCDNDPSFIDLMAERINAIDPLVSEHDDQNAINFSNQYIPLNFFSTEDQSQKKQVIIREIKPNDEAFAIFSAQFLLNSLLKQKVKKLMDASIRKDELDNIVQSLNGNDLSDLPKLVDNLKDQINKYHLSRKKAHVSYKKLQNSLLQKNKAENEMKIKIEQLQVQNETLENEVNLLKVRVQVAANELLLKPSASEVKGVSIMANEENASLLKNELIKKRDEISKLRTMLQSMQNDMNQLQKQHSKSSKRTEEDLMQQIAQLQQQLQETNEENEQLKKKLKRIKKEFMKKYEESYQEYQKKYDESKQSFDDATVSMKEKQKQSHELTQKLLQSLNESEDYNQKYQSENNDLHMENKALQIKIAALQDDVSKERQVLKGQLSALQLACDAKIQDVMRHTKQSIQNEKDRLFTIIVNSLSSVYKIDCSQFDEDSFVRLVGQLKKDIEKLRFFQNSAQYPQ